MRLNTIKPAEKSRKNIKRLGRGMGSGKGKTCGKGHKGQKARSGYKKKLHFEGGQMPKQRRLPKTGFNSSKQARKKIIRSFEMNKIKENVIDINILKNHKMISKKDKYVKIILNGLIKKKFDINGIRLTNGVKLEIEKNGGKIS